MAPMAASRVLVVEDSDAIRVAVGTALRAQGYQVTERADGGNLEADLGRAAPDAVVLDVMLPGRDGFALLDLVRRSCDAAVIMLTARDTTADRVRGLSAGADDYLVKPFAMAELVARLKAVLRRSRPSGGIVRIGDRSWTTTWSAWSPAAIRCSSPRPSGGCWAISPGIASRWSARPRS